MKSGLLIISLLGLCGSTCGQEIPRDTSYTVNSTLAKVRRHYPDLEVSAAAPVSPDGVRMDRDESYRTFEDSDRVLVANVFYPEIRKKGRKYPGILLIHGGGWRTGDKSLMTPMAERLAEAGYVVIAPEYRLSLEAPYPAAVHDLKAALEWMRMSSRRYAIDVNRIAVIGCSAGGQLAALVGTISNNTNLEEEGESTVHAIVDIDGVLAFKHPESREGDMAAQWLGGTYEEVPNNWEQASALTHVDKNTPPTLFIGSAYPRFLAGRADFVAKLDSFGIVSDTKIFPDAPHSFWLLNPWFEPTVDYVIQFLDRTLKASDN